MQKVRKALQGKRPPHLIGRRPNTFSPTHRHRPEDFVKINNRLARSQRCLDRLPGNLAARDYPRAANALRRAAKHAVIAAAIHRRCPYYNRRQLITVFNDLLHDGKIADASHLHAFHQTYQLPAQVAAASAAEAPRLICHTMMPVCRLRAAIVAAIGVDTPAPDPNAPSPWEKAAAVLARSGNRPLSPLEIVAIARPEARYLLHQQPDCVGRGAPSS